MLLVLPVFVIVLYYTMSKSIPLYTKVQRKLDDISLHLRENLSGVRVIRAFAGREKESDKFDLARSAMEARVPPSKRNQQIQRSKN